MQVSSRLGRIIRSIHNIPEHGYEQIDEQDTSDDHVNQKQGVNNVNFFKILAVIDIFMTLFELFE